MSHKKYIRLTSEHISEFVWTKTRDQQIIVRSKEDGEIFALIERPTDQKCLIADAYHAGYTTAYNLRANYINFLEELTAPLMPDYVEPTLPYQEEYDQILHSNVYITNDTTDQTAENYVYDIIIPPSLLEQIKEINEKTESQYAETFYAHACMIWIEDAKTLTNVLALAVPYDGVKAKVYLNNDDHKMFQWLSLESKHSITDLLYTAIRSMADSLKAHLNDENVINISEVKKTPSNNKIIKPKELRMMTVSAVTN